MVKNRIIDSKFFENLKEVRSRDIGFEKTRDYLVSQGVRQIIEYDNFNHEILIFFDDYILCCQDSCYRDIYQKIEPFIFSYSIVRDFRMIRKNSSGAFSIGGGTTKGNPVKGAVIGGILAGSTGAVIGATATSQPKVISPHTISYDKEDYILTIDFSSYSSLEIPLFSFNNKKNRPDEGLGRFNIVYQGMLLGNYFEYVYKTLEQTDECASNIENTLLNLKKIQ